MVLFSDLHGHHEALHLLLQQFSDQTVVSVGDVLGRAGSNMACLEALRERNIPSVQGNHELRMLDSVYRDTVEDWAAEWIRRWPLELIDDEALVVHTLLDFTSLVFTGHLHLPGYLVWSQGRVEWRRLGSDAAGGP